MREFFKPWRAKVGLVTLLMACFFMAGWMRSFFAFDQLYLSPKESLEHVFDSFNGHLRWWTYRGPLNRNRQSLFECVRSSPMSDSLGSDDYIGIQWRFRLIGFGSGEDVDTDARYSMKVWTIPYWFIVLLLCLLSARLMLSKPRLARTPERSLSTDHTSNDVRAGETNEGSKI